MFLAGHWPDQSKIVTIHTCLLKIWLRRKGKLQDNGQAWPGMGGGAMIP